MAPLNTHCSKDLFSTALLPAARRAVVGLLLAVFVTNHLFSAEEKKRFFRVPAATADESLPLIAKQSRIDIVYNPRVVAEVETPAIRGLYTAGDALNRLLADTPLRAVRDEESIAFAVVRESDLYQVPGSSVESVSNTTNANQPESDMDIKKMNVSELRKAIIAAAAASVATTAAIAQDDTEEEVYELSPFEVRAQDQGYYATDSLAGTRMRTEMKNLSQQIQVFTPEFLDDIGAATAQEAFLYSTNLEGILEYTPSTGGFGVVNADNLGRSRGLGNSLTRSRNFFPTLMPLETYNTERTTISSGPNAILFSRGDPSGVVDVSLARAQLNRDRGKVRHRYDDFLKQHRLEFDYNKVLVKDKLALRLSFLHDRGAAPQMPSGDDKDAFYAALTFKPFEKTTLRYHYENFRRNIRRSNTRLTYDAATPYLEFLEANPNFPGFDNSLENLDTNGNGSVSGGEFNDAVARAGLTGIISSSANVGQYNNRPSFNLGATDGEPILSSWGDFNDRRIAWTNPWTRSVDAITGDFGTNPDIFGGPYEDLFTSNVWGMNLRERDYEIHTAFLQQNLFKGLDLEIGYNKEDMDEANNLSIGGNALTLIRVDPNMYLLDGSPNPDVNKPWVGDRMRGGIENQTRETLRAALSYELDFTESDNWTKWLGEHRFAFLKQEVETRTVEGDWSLLVPVDADLGTYSATAGSTGNNNRAGFRFYLDPDAGIFGPSIGQSGVADFESGPYTVTALDGTPLTLTNQLRGNTSGGGSDESSDVFAWQGYLLNGRIVPFYGKRSDDFDTLSGIGGNPATFDLSGHEYELASSESGDTENIGIVVHPLNWLSFSYNESELLAPATDVRSPLDNTILPGNSGTGEDYSVRFDLFESKLIVRINYFETASINNNVGNDEREVRTFTSSMERAIRDDDYWANFATCDGCGAIDPTLAPFSMDGATGFNPINDGDTPDDSNAFNTNDYNARADIEAEGYDIEVNYNIKPNWNMKFTAGRQKGVTSNVAERWAQYVNLRQTDWASVTDQRQNSVTFGQTGWANIDWDGLPGADEEGRTTLQSAFEFSTPGEGATRQVPSLVARLRTNAAQNGTSEGQVKEWRANLFTNYKFNEGRFKGFSLGGGFRFRDKPIIGYQPRTIEVDDPLNPGTPAEITVNDVEKPWYGVDNTYFDLKFGYRTKIMNDRYDWNVQLNIRNVFDEDSFNAAEAATNTGFIPFVFVQEMPRQLILTNTLTF